MSADTRDVKGGNMGSIREIKSTLNKKSSKENITFTVRLFLIIGIVVGIEYALISLIGSNQLDIGGTALSIQFGIFALLASGIFAVLIGYYIGQRSPDHSVATISSGVGTFIGALTILFCLLFVEQVISSDFVSDIVQLSVRGSLSMLFIYSVGVGIAGSISAYYGYLSNNSSTIHVDENNYDLELNDIIKNPVSFGRLSRTVILNRLDEFKTIVYLFVFIGAGYGISVILLNFLTFDFEYVAIIIAFLGSYAILFFSPLLAAVFGYRIGNIIPGASGVIIAGAGSGLGYILMFLTMTILGALGVSGNPLDVVEALGGVLAGVSANPLDMLGGIGEILSEAGTTVDAFYSGLLSLIPRAYEISNIMIAGSIGTAISGGIAAFITNHKTEVAND